VSYRGARSANGFRHPKGRLRPWPERPIRWGPGYSLRSRDDWAGRNGTRLGVPPGFAGDGAGRFLHCVVQEPRMGAQTQCNGRIQQSALWMSPWVHRGRCWNVHGPIQRCLGQAIQHRDPVGPEPGPGSARGEASRWGRADANIIGPPRSAEFIAVGDGVGYLGPRWCSASNPRQACSRVPGVKQAGFAEGARPGSSGFCRPARPKRSHAGGS